MCGRAVRFGTQRHLDPEVLGHGLCTESNRSRPQQGHELGLPTAQALDALCRRGCSDQVFTVVQEARARTLSGFHAAGEVAVG